MIEEIPKYNFKNGLPHEFEIINFEKLFLTSSDEITKPHRTDFYQILWFKEGSATHLVDFNPIKVKANTFLFINKNSVHFFDKKYDYSGKALLFTDSFFCKTTANTLFLKSNILFNDLFTVSKIDISESLFNFETIFNQLEIELNNKSDIYQPDLLRNLLHNLLLLSERERRKQDFIEIKKDANLELALLFKNLLDSNFITEKKVIFYSNKMNITSKRLKQVTSKIFGKTPKEIIDDRILLECKRVLSYTNESIKEISYSLGFEEPTNFIKYFKKHTQKTPLTFRAEFNLV